MRRLRHLRPSRRPPTSPTWGFTPCSTGARRAPGIATGDGEQDAGLPGDGARRRCLHARRPRQRCPATSRSAIPATRPPARAGSQNAQPMLIDCAHGQIAIAHNGNIVNARELRDELVRNGSIFQTSSDTEVVLHLYARSRAAVGRRGAGRVGDAGQRRVLARAPDEEPADRRARSARVPSAGARPARRRLDRLLGNLRARPDRRHLRARHRARRSRWSSATAACARCIRSRPRRSRTACSSTSTSRGPTATCSGGA